MFGEVERSVFLVPLLNRGYRQGTLNGCGRARLDYGNCYFCFFCDSSNYNFVFVRLNGIEISTK